MPIDFIDRVSGKPGRVKITPEGGGSPYYAVLERADEATVVGTPLNATNLNAAQETLVYQDDVSAHTYKRVYIAPNGNDGNTGASTNAPMATVRAAIRKYAKWHKYMDIYLLDGEYTEDIGTISTDHCSLSIRSNSENKEAVTINISTMLESHITLLRLYNITINMTANNTRALSINAGMLYAFNVRINMPSASTANLLNVYNGASVFMMDCVLNAGTGHAVYGNQALHIKVFNCTSERSLTKGFYANNGSNIEYTPTITAKTLYTEAAGGKCIEVAAKPGSVKGSMKSQVGQYMTYDGLLLQWGVVTITPTASNTPTTSIVTFPLPYAESPTVFATPITSVPENISVGILRSGELISDAKKMIGVTLTRVGTTSTGINWLAIGPGIVAT